MRGLSAHAGDFVPAVTLDDDWNVANGNAEDALDAYEMSAKRTVRVTCRRWHHVIHDAGHFDDDFSN